MSYYFNLKRELGFLFVEEYCFPTHGRFKNGFEPVYLLQKVKLKT